MLTIFLLSPVARVADNAGTVDPAYRHASPEAYERWRDPKYRVRIHWGVYSLLGVEASWPFRDMSNQKKQEYQELYKKFNRKRLVVLSITHKFGRIETKLNVGKSGEPTPHDLNARARLKEGRLATGEAAFPTPEVRIR